MNRIEMQTDKQFQINLNLCDKGQVHVIQIQVEKNYDKTRRKVYDKS